MDDIRSVPALKGVAIASFYGIFDKRCKPFDILSKGVCTPLSYFA